MNTVTKQDRTKDIIISMLKENTGMHFLDSGGAYGRNWERNQKRSFESEPACQVDISEQYNEISISYNIYHFLVNYLEHDGDCANWQKSFDTFALKAENIDKAWDEIIGLWLKNRGFKSFGGGNTYNNETLLSQDFQYNSFSPDGDEYNEYIFLQIHGGCDIRGGYTEPKNFRIPDRDYFYLAMSDCSAYCKNCRADWYSDDCGYHWYIGNGGLISKPDNQIEMPNLPKPEPIQKEFSEVIIKGNKALCPVCNHEVKFSVSEGY